MSLLSHEDEVDVECRRPTVLGPSERTSVHVRVIRAHVRACMRMLTCVITQREYSCRQMRMYVCKHTYTRVSIRTHACGMYVFLSARAQ
jgi:hypothetical protein